MATDKNSDSAGSKLQQPISKCPQNYKPWIWTLVVMAAITTAWAVYEGFQKDGYFTNAFNRGGDSSGKPQGWNSKKFAMQSALAPEQAKGLQTSYHTIIDSVRPAVITIDAVGNTPVAGVTPPPEIEAEIPVAAFSRIGSGVIIEPRGYVLSSYHVIAGAQALKATVYGPGGALQYPLKLVKADMGSDLALLRIQGTGPFPFATLGDSDAARTGDMILTMGNPFGFDQTVTSGMISSRNRTLKIEGVVYENLIQTDSPINRGSSGGPLVSVKGEVIGINTAIFAPTGVFNGIGFAIPINRASELVGGVIDFNNTAPDVGTGQLAAWARCGRQIGNTFRLPSGQTIVAPHPFRGNCVDCHPQLLSQTAPGVNNVAQGTKQGTVRVALPGQKVATTEPTLGVALLNVDEINARQLNIVVPEGALVNNVVPGGPAEAAGLQRGDVLLRIDGRKIRDIETITDFIAAQKVGKRFEIVYLRNGSRQTTKIKTGVKSVAAAVAAPPVRQPGEFEWKGGDFTPLSPALTPYVKNGVYVADIEGVMALAGLKVGDIIVGVDGKPVTDLNSFMVIAKTLDLKKGFMLDVVRAGNPLYITVKG